jgi:hypothetical protein
LVVRRRPRARRSRAIYAVSAIVSPLLHPGREQGLTPDHWGLVARAAVLRECIVVCAIAPIVEELTFRGVGYGLIAARFGTEPRSSPRRCSFGLAHGLVEALPLLVAFGIASPGCARARDSTVPGIVLHACSTPIASRCAGRDPRTARCRARRVSSPSRRRRLVAMSTWRTGRPAPLTYRDASPSCAALLASAVLRVFPSRNPKPDIVLVASGPRLERRYRL